MSDIAEIIKEEIEGNVIIEEDKNTTNCKMEIKRGVISFDVENLIKSLLGFRKMIYKPGKFVSHKIIDMMGFNSIIICDVFTLLLF